MEAPPPYMPPRKKSNTGLIVGLIIGGVVLCCIGPIAAIVGGGLWVVNKAMPLAGCSFAFEDARNALRAYAADHNGKFPPADQWQTEVRPYYEQQIGKHKDMGPITLMPSAGPWGCTHEGVKYGMAYNEDVANKELLQAEKDDDVLLFEVKTPAENAHQKYAPQSDADAPVIMFGEKGWFMIKTSGDPLMLSKGKEAPIRMQGRG